MKLKSTWATWGAVFWVAQVVVLAANNSENHWAFQKPEKPPLPSVSNSDWPRERLDFFILARIEKEGLRPSPEASPRELARRLSYGLTGLPPDPDWMEAFLFNPAPNAYELAVEELMNSVAFGERMASHWLNVARYAEDQAHQVGDDVKHFYPNAFRYRQWVIDAFNQDLSYDEFIRQQLAADFFTEAAEDQVALGFLGLGPKYYNRGRLEVMADEWEDRVDTVTRTFLGLTVACARCHDHKFDPISSKDYYALAGVFASTEMVNRPLSGAKEGDVYETVHIVKEGEPKDLPVFVRGDVTRKGELAPRGFLPVLCEGKSLEFQVGSGRKELAEAIASKDNPLTARVLVNRVWMWVFGRGLSATPSNFGALGDPPSHPELLDDLAVRFLEQGQSIKTLIREMVLSATYRQSSIGEAEFISKDGENRWMSRAHRRRLDAEMYRDSLMAFGNNLDGRGGRSRELTDNKNHLRTVYSRISRLELDSYLRNFDYPDPNVHQSKRAVTITPLQTLYRLNAGFVVEQARNVAQRFEVPGDPESAVRGLYRGVLFREPSLREKELAEKFLQGEGVEGMSRWEQFVQAILTLNEVMYID